MELKGDYIEIEKLNKKIEQLEIELDKANQINNNPINSSKFLINFLQEFIFILDDDNNIIECNNQANDFFNSNSSLINIKFLTLFDESIQNDLSNWLLDFTNLKSFELIYLKNGIYSKFELLKYKSTSNFIDVTHIIAKNKDVGINEDSLARKYQSQSTMMGVLDIESFRFLDVNELFLKTLGFTKEFIIGKTPKGAKMIFEFEDEVDFIKKVKQKKPIRDFYIELRTKNHDVRKCLMSADIIKFHGIDNLIIELNDITNLMNSRDEIKVIQEQLSNIMATLSDVIWSCDYFSGNYLFISQAIKNITGFDDEDFYRNPLIINSLIFIDDLNIRREALHNLLDEGKYEIYFRINDRNGNLKTLFEKGLLVRDEQDLPIRIDGITSDVSDRFAMEEDLRKSEEKYRKVIDNISQIIFQTDPNGFFTLLNTAWEEILGFSISESLGKQIFHFVQSEDKESLKQIFISMYNLEIESNRHTARYITKNNSMKWLEVYLTVLKNDESNFIGTSGTITDITERKLAEDTIKASEERFKLAAKAANLGIWDWDIKNDKFTMDDGLIDLYDFTVNSQHVREIVENKIQNDILNNLKNDLYKSLRNLQPLDSLYQISTDLNDNKYLKSYADIYTDENNKPIRMIGVNIDVSNLKEIETKLLYLNSLYSLITKISTNLLQVKSNELELVIEQQLKMLGEFSFVDRTYIFEVDFEANSLICQYEWVNNPSISMKSAKQPISLGLVNRWMARFYKNEQLLIKNVSEIPESNKIERIMLEKQGIISLLLIPIYYNQKLTGFIGFDTVRYQKNWEKDEISLLNLVGEIIAGTLSRKKFEDEIINSSKIAEEANKSKSEFLANMSHEIRTPLNAILGLSEIILNTAQDSQIKSYVNTILSSGQTLLTLINDILDLSKIEAGKMEIKYLPTNLLNTISDIIKIFEQKCADKGIEIKFTYDDSFDFALKIDEVRIRQVLFNLIGNAVKFTHHGFVKVQLFFNQLDENFLELRVNVIDSGIGIPHNQLDAIFESFKQASGHDARQYGGTGLGLAITKKLVTMMGGDISVESEVGVGSKFKVIFNKIEIVNHEVSSDNLYLWKDVTDFASAKILIVDDMEINRELIKMFIKKYNFEIYEAVNGVDSIEKALEIKPDLIFMDLRMPQMNGAEASKHIHSYDETKHIPIIAVTANIIELHENEDYKNLFNDYISKPITRADIIEKLQKYIINKQKDIIIDDSHQNEEIHEIQFDLENYNEIRDLFIVKIENLIEHFVFDDILKFANDFEKYLSSKKITFLKKEVNHLKLSSSTFDFDGIEKSFKSIIKVFETIKITE